MRFFIKLIIGMLLFNAFIFLLVPFFPNHYIMTNDAVNVTDKYSQQYDPGANLSSTILQIITNSWFLSVFGAFCLIGGVGGVLSGRSSPVFIGLAIVIGLVAALYVSTMAVFFNIADEYPIVLGLLSIITLAIGIFFIFSIADMLSGRSDVD